MLKQNLSLLAAAAVLASCGGANNIAEIVTKTIGNDVIVMGATPDQTSINAAMLSDASFQPDHDAGALKAWRTPSSADKGYFGQSSSGGSVVFVAGTNGTTENILSLAIARTAPTTLPTSGTTTYTGDYAGVYEHDDTDPDELDFMTGLVTGDAEIVADFKNNTVEGTISNRVLRSAVTNEVSSSFDPADVSLSISPLYSDGSFSGVATGGQLIRTDPSLTGEYQGLISGAASQEAIGGIRLVHQADPGNSSTIELGVFLAE
ncbi:MAG: hypothetical protein ACRBBK_07555 [Paracoccaceae bacterium]